MEFKIETVHPNGKASDVDTTGHAASSSIRSVFLVQAVHNFISPRESKTVEVNTTPMDDIGVVTPSETVANVLCNFQSGPAVQYFELHTLNNWGNELVTLTKGQQVGSVEPAVVVPAVVVPAVVVPAVVAIVVPVVGE